MKRILFFLTTMALVSMQFAGAWGYKSASDGWSNVSTDFWQQEHFYNSVLIDEPTQWDVHVALNPGDGFNITQNDDGSGQQLYVQLTGLAATSENTIVRATCKWDGGLYTNHTVVIPDGKIYVSVDGTQYEMSNLGNYQFEAIVPATAATTGVTVYGDDVDAPTISNDNDMPAAGLPSSVKLAIADVPVVATAAKIIVKYNLWWNQVIVQDFVSEICDWEFTPNGIGGGTPDTGSDAYVLFTWETMPNGTVEIRIAPHPDNAETATPYGCFRGANGMATDGFSLSGGLTFGSYFAKALSSDKKTVILTPLQTLPEGTIINFSGMCEYKTDNDNAIDNGNNFYPNITFPAYTYGSNCSGIYAQKLATPTNVAVDAANILTFDQVANANTYFVTISLNDAVLQTFSVSGSGEEITNFPFSGAFSLTVIASDNTGVYANSDASNPFTWNYTAPDQTVSSSTVCDAVFGDSSWGLNISIETAIEADGDIQPGDIVFSLTGSQASFRAAGVRLENITVGGISGANVLTKIGPDGSDDGQPVVDVNVFRPIAGLAIAKGTPVVYNGELEARCSANTNIWGTRTFNYVYGTACTAPQLNPPTDLAVGAGNALTFTPDPNAASTTIFVSFNSVVIMALENFSSGDIINIPVNGTFIIAGQSISGDPLQFANSDLSETVEIVVNIADQTSLPYSQYCEYDLPNPGEIGTSGETPNVTLTTFGADIVVTLNGNNQWRNNGIAVNGWYIGDVKAATLLDKISAGTDNPQIFTPKAGITIPKGALISYICSAGTAFWEWGPGNGWQDAGTIFANYPYGAVCSPPSGMQNVDNQNVLLRNTFAENILFFNNAENMQVLICDLSGKTVFYGKVTNEQINISTLSSGIYLLNIDNKNFKFIKQ